MCEFPFIMKVTEKITSAARLAGYDFIANDRKDDAFLSQEDLDIAVANLYTNSDAIAKAFREGLIQAIRERWDEIKEHKTDCI